MKRWGMRNPSVSTTSAGPMATPGETGMPRLISILLTVSSFAVPPPLWFLHCLGSRGPRVRTDSLSRRSGDAILRQPREQISEGLHGLFLIGARDFQDQLRPLSSQTNQGNPALAVEALAVPDERHVALKLLCQRGERGGRTHVQSFRIGDDNRAAERFAIHGRC